MVERKLMLSEEAIKPDYSFQLKAAPPDMLRVPVTPVYKKVEQKADQATENAKRRASVVLSAAFHVFDDLGYARGFKMGKIIGMISDDPSKITDARFSHKKSGGSSYYSIEVTVGSEKVYLSALVGKNNITVTMMDKDRNMVEYLSQEGGRLERFRK